MSCDEIGAYLRCEFNGGIIYVYIFLLISQRASPLLTHLISKYVYSMIIIINWIAIPIGLSRNHFNVAPMNIQSDLSKKDVVIFLNGRYSRRYSKERKKEGKKVNESCQRSKSSTPSTSWPWSFLGRKYINYVCTTFRIELGRSLRAPMLEDG